MYLTHLVYLGMTNNADQLEADDMHSKTARVPSNARNSRLASVTTDELAVLKV